MTTRTLLQEFYNDLDEKQKNWFDLELPNLILRWFNGYYMGQGESDALQLATPQMTYRDTDALAVALFHLRSIYLKEFPNRLSRISRVKGKPKDGKFQFSAKNFSRSLTSWTSDPRPLKNRSITEFILEDDNFYLLTWSPVDPKLVVATFDSIMALTVDADAIKPSSNAWARCKRSILKNTLWRKQKEVLVYLQKKSITIDLKKIANT